MEASDTVIKNEDIMDLDIPCETCEEKPAHWHFITKVCLECIALKHREAQDEVTWTIAHKAGQESGINEVVDWINSHSGEVILKVKHLNGMTTTESSTCLQFYKQELQAFLKSKGIESK